jgi:hypothetical protein
MKYQIFKRYIFNSLSKNINLIWEDIHSFAVYLLRSLGKSLKKSYNKLKNYNYYNLLTFLNRIKNKVYRHLKSYAKSSKIKNYIAYSLGFILINIFIYISIPFFFNYNKSIVNKYCSAVEMQCLIDGKIKYTFFPSPRLKFKNLTILDSDKKILANINNVSIKMAISRLTNQNQFKFTKIKIKNSEVNFYLSDLKKYKKIVNKLDITRPFIFKRSNVNFFDDNKKKITNIKEANIKIKSLNNVILKGIFLGDEIRIDYETSEKNNKSFVLKLVQSKILVKINVFDKNKNEKIIKGDALFKKDKNRMRSVFAYENDQVVFENADIRNEFLNGKLAGYIKFLPFFDFDLDLDLKGFNFKRLYTYLSKMKKEEISKLFQINYKVNGKLNLSTNKIYSKYDLINSFETYIKFSNGNILIDKLLFNLGKLGAADITGIIKTDKKYTSFKFENNIYIDSKKHFIRKFSIFDDKKISNNLFTSGTLDLINFNMRFSEMASDVKFKDDDISYIEKEFNYYMFDDGVVSFFNFSKLKEFIKSVISD